MSGTTEDKKSLSSDSIDYVAFHWQRLPPHIRETIVTLVDAAIATVPTSTLAKSPDKARGEV